jgi:hypothetical protein
MHRVPVGAASGRAPREWLPALVLTLLLASTAAADVTIQETSVSEGLGGFGNGTTRRTMLVAGDMSRSEDEATYTGRFKTLAGGGKPRTSISITRIDKEVLWDLDPQKKTYTEITFAEMRELMAKGLAEAGPAPDAEPRDGEMTFTVDVKRTGAKQDVNGFAAEQVVVTCVGRPKDAGADAKDREVRFVMDLWLTKSAPGAKEMTEFGRRFAAKMGLDPQLASIGGTVQRMYGGAMKELAARMKDLDGYPVRSTFTIDGASGPTAARPAEGPSPGAGTPAVREREKAQAEADEKAQDRQDAGDIGAAAASGEGVTGKLGGLLGRKLTGLAQRKTTEKVENGAGEKASPGAAGGHLLKVVTEVTSISTSPAPAGSFEVPAGYKLQKRD